MEVFERERSIALIKKLTLADILRYGNGILFTRDQKRKRADMFAKLMTLSNDELAGIVRASSEAATACFKDGTGAQQVLGAFTVADLLTVCDMVVFTAGEKKTKADVIAKIMQQGEADHDEIRQRLSNRKRKRSDSPFTRSNRPNSRQAVAQEFLKRIDIPTVHDRIARFIARTDNESLLQAVCGVCARELSHREVDTLLLEDIPNNELLYPETPHPGHDLTHGFLLHKPRTKSGAPVQISDDISDVEVVVCRECLRDLKVNKVPIFALANGMWIGDTPHELAVLTLPERILVARYFPAAHIVKLFPKRKFAKYWDPEKLNSGVRGNVSTYWLDPDSVSDMLQGDIMPPSASILAATIGVTIIGPKNLPESTLPGFLRVRRGRVASALSWLKKNNPLYADITINQDRLSELPVDDIPPQILATTRFSSDTVSLERERSGYVASRDDDDFESEDEPEIDDERQTRRSRNGIDQYIGREESMENDPKKQTRGRDGVNIIYSDLIDVAAHLSRDVRTGHEDPGVFTLQSLGVIDVTGASIPDKDILAHALANASNAERSKGYAVKRGSAFVNEYSRRDEDTGEFTDGGTSNPNHLYGAFPGKFPFAAGGLETTRRRKVPYEAHVRWALQYQDKRFRKDLHFIFQVFGVIQKRQVCRSAELQINKAVYKRHEAAIRRLKPADLLKAAVEEKRKCMISNPATRSLRELVSGLRVKVSGTDESRTGMRSQIWGITTMKNPPSLWVTINPSDTHDPIAQVLAGEDIDLDNFCATAGPDNARRSMNVASDPFAAAKFFHFIIRAIIEELFGISANKDSSKVHREDGIFGSVEAYVGSVEAQGRGTLHLHLIIWLTGAPTASDMLLLLQTEQFRSRVRDFITANIRADFDNAIADMTSIKKKKKPDVSYSRPLNPSIPNYAEEAHHVEKKIARTVQYHECKPNACQNLIKGEWVCKRRAPFELSTSDYVNADGSWGVKRLFQFFNSWCPAILQCVRANHDIKLITNGGETKDITWYITNYATKKQRQSSNASALIAKRLAYHNVEEKWNTDPRAVNKRLLARCANTLTRDHEFSAPEVISYLMGWGDRYISHHFTTIYWSGVVAALKRSFPELRKKRYPLKFASGHTTKDVAGDEYLAGEDNTETENMLLQQRDGQLELRDQLKDYVDRGLDLEDTNFLDFFLNTYPERSPSISPINQRVPYISGSGREGKSRVVRTSGHETMPNFIGRWFTRRDDKEEHTLYCAEMLALLKPWRKIEDLNGFGRNFETTFAEWKSSATQSALDMLDNIQYYHDSGDGSRRKKHDGPSNTQLQLVREEEEDDNMGAPMSEGVSRLTEEDVEIARDNSVATRESNHGALAMAIAYNTCIFNENQIPKDIQVAPLAKVANLEDMRLFRQWDDEIQGFVRNSSDNKLVDQTLGASLKPSRVIEPSVQRLEENNISQPIDVSYLNTEQNRAYEIVHQHLTATLKHRKPPQLLMTVIGPGGTGKTALINEITRLFESMNARRMLAKTATSGVAATLIGGTTLHFWGALPMISPKSDGWMETSNKSIKERRLANILPTDYLIIDEASMATSELVTFASGMASYIKQDSGNSARAFGGINVILFGDFHQFPPPGKQELALYNSRPPNQTATVGRAIYLQFDTVVILREQMRIKDKQWMEILNRARIGECTCDDIKEIRSLVMTETTCDVPDFTYDPWKSATLVTPRHGVRNPWNEECINRHCATTGHRKYIFEAEDTVGKDRRPLTIGERVVVAGISEKKSARLPGRISIAIGMKAMVTWNIATDADLANGARGEIVDIILDPREGLLDTSGLDTTLSYPPVMVLFKPMNDSNCNIGGLGKGLIPIFPSEGTFSALLPNGKRTTITRRQLAITASYAFTDYRSQGQTLEYALVDIGKTPSGKLSPFSAYVALSRSRGRDTIRLLRDFDDALFTNHPSEELRDEDDRLQTLDLDTKDKFVANYYSSWNI